MATILDLLRQQEPQNRLAGYDRIRQDSGAAQPLPMGQMPQGGPQMAAQANFAPQAPAYQPQPQTAPQGGSGGAMGGALNGIGDFVGNLLMPDRAGRNQTIQWLQGQGMDEGMATMLASNKPALQKFLFDRAQGGNPRDALEMEKLALEVEEKRNPTTDDIREYNLYVKQLRESGQEPEGFTQWLRGNKTAGAQNITIGGEKAWETESAKLFAKRYDELTTQAGKASEMLGLYDLAAQGLDSGVRTGSLGSQEQAVRQLGLALGIGDADKVAGGELLTAVQNRMALLMRSPDSGMGMPGAVSDRDLTFLKEAQIGLDRSPEGNRRMLEAFRALERRKVEIAQLADQYIMENGRLDVGFNRMVREYAEANPLFPEAETRPQRSGRVSSGDDPLGIR